MPNPKVISIDGQDYVRADSVPSIPKGDRKIVVLQRGWVVIGDRTLLPDGDYQLTSAATIRVWGTTKGLGELKDGPTSKTVLDPAGVVTYNPLTAVFTIAVDASKWTL